MTDTRIKELSEDEFLASRDAWNDVLDASDGSPLFSSWEWCSTWWQHFGNKNALTLRAWIAVDAEGRWLAIAPMFDRVTRVKGLLPVRRRELIGNLRGGPHTMRSEYLGILFRHEAKDAARQLLDAVFDDARWQELVCSDQVAGSSSRRLLEERLAGAVGARQVDPDQGYRVGLEDGFDDYLQSLSGGARRSLYNKRARLEGHGTPRVEPVEVGDMPRFVEQLSAFHEARWGHKWLGGPGRAFHLDLLENGAGRVVLAASRMYVGERLVSTLYDLRAGGLQYNIQMGFDPGFDTRLSLGLLHMGYAIEAAASEGVRSYEMLVGGGKQGQYKHRLATEVDEASTLQFIKAGWLRTLYRVTGRV